MGQREVTWDCINFCSFIWPENFSTYCLCLGFEQGGVVERALLTGSLGWWYFFGDGSVEGKGLEGYVLILIHFCDEGWVEWGAKAVMDPQNHPFFTRFVLLPPSSEGSSTRAEWELFWNQMFSLTVKRIREKSPNTQRRTFRVSTLAPVCKGLPNNSWAMFFTRSQRMVVCVCERVLAVYNTDTQVFLFSSFLSRGSCLCVCGYSKASPHVS